MPTTTEELFARTTAPESSASALPKALLLFAHPDDETIALGARMGRFASSCLVHVTDGAPRNEGDSRANGLADWREYREVRQQELEDAIRLAGLGAMTRMCLEIPDQQASLNLVALTRKVAALIEQYRPEVVITHPYEGGHPDHDACAFAVHHAEEASAARIEPLIVEAAFYHAGPGGIETGTFLDCSNPTLNADFQLTPEERNRKRDLLACFTTQKTTLGYFSLTHERFRIAPRYDFSQPPHAGGTFYDGFAWGMTSERFCDLAKEAEDVLRREVTIA